MTITQTFKVRISKAALADINELRIFLHSMMTEVGAIRYAEIMRAEIKMLSVYADYYGQTTSKTLLNIHPNARRMISHNRQWIYVFHVEEDFVIVDRIMPAKMNKG